jgi:hypothetical protein
MKANIFQIFRDEPTRSRGDPGFAPLDNTASLKPDWREYWAIRNFFLSNSVNEDELYGFLSSDFREKTALSAASVLAFISDNPGHEVYTFSPSIQDGACYLNVFEQGNRLQPGFIEAAEAYLREIQLDIDLRTLAMDSRATVYSNYLVARPSFWKTWFALTEKLVDLFVDELSDFRRCIDSIAVSPSSVGMEVLLVERIASLVLALCPDIEVCAFDPSSMPLPNPAYRAYGQQMAFLNELKAGFRRTEDKTCLSNFYALRGAVLQASEGKRLDRAKDGFLTTPLPASPELLYVCFTHVPLPFEFPSYVSPLYLGDAQGPGKANLRDLAPEWEPYHPLLGATAGSFALKNYIVENELQVRQVGICQYRKFVSAGKISRTPAPNYPIMDVVNRQMLEDTRLAEVMAPGDRDFLLGQPGVVEGGYYTQYTVAHVAEDFLRFTAEAVELGVLTSKDVLPFFNSHAFMPGGIEIGVFPADFWVRAISSIEAVVRASITRYPLRREGYQARSWAFCAERLGSYLLLQHLTTVYPSSVWQGKFIGQLNLFTHDDQTMYLAGR